MPPSSPDGRQIKLSFGGIPMFYTNFRQNMLVRPTAKKPLTMQSIKPELPRMVQACPAAISQRAEDWAPKIQMQCLGAKLFDSPRTSYRG